MSIQFHFYFISFCDLGRRYGDTVLDSGLWDSICHQVNIGTTENELSPLGLLTAVRIIYGNLYLTIAPWLNPNQS